MKKILFVALAMAMFAGNANALENEPEEGFTYMGLFGMNISKLQNSGYDAKAGAMMGARVDYVLPNAHGTYLTAGLDWTMKGGKRTFEDFVIDDDEDVTYKYALHYLEIPIRVGFRYNVLENLGIYGEVGPYFAIGIGGKHKCSVDEDGYSINGYEDARTFKAFKKADYDPDKPWKLPFQRWDAGIGFRIGAEYNQHYNLMFGCDWGLTDMYRDGLRDSYSNSYFIPVDAYSESPEGGIPVMKKTLSKVHNFNFSITFGYRF